jgi:hypothetical protein
MLYFTFSLPAALVCPLSSHSIYVVSISSILPPPLFLVCRSRVAHSPVLYISPLIELHSSVQCLPSENRRTEGEIYVCLYLCCCGIYVRFRPDGRYCTIKYMIVTHRKILIVENCVCAVRLTTTDELISIFKTNHDLHTRMCPVHYITTCMYMYTSVKIA